LTDFKTIEKKDLCTSSSIISIASSGESGDREHNILSSALHIAIGSITDPEILRKIADEVLEEISGDINDSQYFDCQAEIEALQSLSKYDVQTDNCESTVTSQANLANEAAQFIENMPHPYDPDLHEDDLNEALYPIQVCLGQDDGGGAGIFFSDDDWFIRWNKATSDESKADLLREYLVAEVGSYLTIKS
jgi:hypothetical protein